MTSKPAHEDTSKRVLRLATTDRHRDQMQENNVVDRYLLGTLKPFANGYEVGYRMVMLWNHQHQFDDFDEIHLYLTSRSSINFGIADAFKKLGIPVIYYEHVADSKYIKFNRLEEYS